MRRLTRLTNAFSKNYAWAVEGAKEPQYIAVVQEPPIKSALDAVRAWLVTQARK